MLFLVLEKRTEHIIVCLSQDIFADLYAHVFTGRGTPGSYALQAEPGRINVTCKEEGHAVNCTQSRRRSTASGFVC